jgi:hypothetical protein
MKRLSLAALSFAALVALAQSATAATRPRRLEIWDLQIGTPVDRLPNEFVDYACGTGGGPPSLPLKGFADFRRCRAEESGLREVYFRYDDELEYWARANNLTGEMEQYAGTKTYGFPIVASALVDDRGVLAGIRIVSDPRYDANRDEAYFLKNFLMSRLGRENWTCKDLPPDEGETPVDGVFFKQDCAKDLGDGRSASLQARHLRKPGQTRFDPRSGKQTVNQFESLVRFEIVAK